IANKIEGAVNTSLQGEINNPEHGPIWPQTFDIDIMLGQTSNVGDPVHYVLQGVKLMGEAQSIDYGGSGMVLSERYNFIARDIKTIG
ncbi:MAG: hypothetical protein IJS84_00655, partial [Spirochaetales bacterium]|nr:hypothetical protein [Spirochaetales bacterium]